MNGLGQIFCGARHDDIKQFSKRAWKRLLEDTSSSSSKSEAIMGIFARMFEIWGKRRSLHKRPTDLCMRFAFLVMNRWQNLRRQVIIHLYKNYYDRTPQRWSLNQNDDEETELHNRIRIITYAEKRRGVGKICFLSEQTLDFDVCKNRTKEYVWWNVSNKGCFWEKRENICAMLCFIFHSFKNGIKPRYEKEPSYCNFW